MIDLTSMSLFDDTDRVMTPLETATMLRTTTKSLERWRATGQGPDFIGLGSRVVRYRLSDIERFLCERLVRNTAQRREQARAAATTWSRRQAGGLTRQRNRRGG